MITEYIFKVKQFLKDSRSDLYVAAVIFLVGLASFGLGRLSVLWPEKEAIRIGNSKSSELSELSTPNSGELNQLNPLNSLNQLKDKYVASQNGTAYHFPWCPGAQRIKEENKVWFDTKEEAERAGYHPAANCEGL